MVLHTMREMEDELPLYISTLFVRMLVLLQILCDSVLAK